MPVALSSSKGMAASQRHMALNSSQISCAASDEAHMKCSNATHCSYYLLQPPPINVRFFFVYELSPVYSSY